MNKSEGGKPTIQYPCRWDFKVIGAAEETLRAAVSECLEGCLGPDGGNRDFEFGGARTSSEGRYVSLALTLTVLDEAERNAVFSSLADRPEIRLVL